MQQRTKRPTIRVCGVAIALATLAFLPLPTLAQNTPLAIPGLEKYAEKKVTMEVESTRLPNALRLLMNSIGADYIIENGLKSAIVTVRLTDSRFDRALQVLFKSSTIPVTCYIENDIFHFKVRTEPEEEPKPEEKKPEPPQPTQEKIEAKNIDPSHLVRLLGGIVLGNSNDNTYGLTDANGNVNGTVGGNRQYSGFTFSNGNLFMNSMNAIFGGQGRTLTGGINHGIPFFGGLGKPVNSSSSNTTIRRP